MTEWTTRWATFSIAIGLLALPAGAQETKKQRQRPQKPLPEVSESLEEGRPPAAATIDRIMEQAVRNIAARYNLNDVQTEKTSELMHREVYRFIKEHENEVWPVIRDLLQYQLRAPDDPEALKRIGGAAQPLARLAQKAILDANEEWRLILTPEQKRMHDFDLSEMHKTFEEINQNFDQWAQGKAGSPNIFPEPRLTGQPPRPPQPPEGKLPEPERDMFNPKHVLETLVENFIREYELDEGQITSARSILEEYKLKAEEFRQNNAEAFTAIVKKYEQAREERDLEAMKKTYQSYRQQLGPVSQLCDDMNERLMALLTTAQRQKHEEERTDEKGEPASNAAIKRTWRDDADDTRAERG